MVVSNILHKEAILKFIENKHDSMKFNKRLGSTFEKINYSGNYEIIKNVMH